MRFQGIVHITGEHDTGKTLMAIGACHPKRTIFFHNDVKAPGISPSEFGFYIDLVSQNLTYLQTKDFFLEVLDSIRPGDYDGIVIDTWTRLGAALISYGKLNATKFRENQTMATGQIYRWGQEWNEGRWYEASIISKMSQLAPYVCLTTHLHDHYQGGAKTGKEVPDCSETLDRVCNLRVWLRHNRDSGVPIALVLKRPSLTKVTERGIEVVNYLPRRLDPKPGETSVWDVIEHYRDNPVDGRPLLNEEEPTEFELSILEGILTDDQKEVWRANLAEQKNKEKVEAELGNEEFELFRQEVLRLKDQPLPIIYQSIKAQFDGKYDMGQIDSVLRG